MLRDSGFEIPEIPKPNAGSGSGYGETLNIDGATGSLQFSVPVFVAQARALTPALALRYGNSRTNGLFGLGFSLDLPAISRRSSLGIPRYTPQDRFVTEAGDVLVPSSQRDGADRWQPVQWQTEYLGQRYRIRAYRRRIESQFDRIECWTRDSDGDSFWKITDSRNITSVYGETADARLADPRAPERVFRWMLQQQYDAKGNRAQYQYRVERQEQASSLYPLSIAYGNFQDGQQQAFAFTLHFLFDQGERPDPQRNYRPGFAVLTRLRCLGFSLSHYFPDELGPKPLETSRTELAYSDADGYSRLQSLRRTGLRHERGTVRGSALPTVEFAFHPPAARVAFQPLQTDKGPLPSALPQRAYSFVDLNGDGLAGILADGTASHAPRYWPPLGDGYYAPGAYLPLSPVTPLDQPGRSVLLDMSGTGKRDSLLLSANRAGFYTNKNPGWDPYLPLQSNNTTLTLPDTRLVDLSGSGRLGLLTGGPCGWQYCESLGRAGFAKPVNVQSPPGMPLYESNSAAIYIGFLNIFDDGLSHLVEAGSGCLRVWPSLGYGRFAPPLTVSGMPKLPSSVGTANLLFADLTGVGGVDLAVVHADRIDIYLNHYGQSLSYHGAVTLPADFGTLDTVQAGDVLGLGVSQLLLNYARQTAKNQYLDLNGGPDPYLLSAVNNGMGVSTRFSYRSSVDYSLKDQALGRAWLSRLPFPNLVVARIEQDDAISATRSVQVMQYAEGYFDPYERQFTGFAWSQQQNDLTVDSTVWHFPCTDSETYRALRAPQGETGPGSEPRLQRSWQYVGDWEQMQRMRQRMLGSIHACIRDTLVLPAPVLSPDFAAEPAASLWLAYRALANRAAVSEIYGVDADGQTRPNPYSASQQAWEVNLVQPALDGHSAVVMVCERESASSRFDQLTDDPHIFHQVQTCFSALGQALRWVEIAYPRQAAVNRVVLPAQARVQMRLSTSGVINHLDGAYCNANGGTTPALQLRDDQPFHAVGLPFENQSFELAGFAPPRRYYSYADAAAIVDASLQHIIAYGEPFTGAPNEARLYGWEQADYWAGDAPAPLQQTAAQLCPRRQPQTSFPPSFVSRFLEDKVSADYLREKGGYRLTDGYWWSDGQTVSYADASGYYQTSRYTDPWGAVVSLQHDRYQLLMTCKTDPLGYSITAENDYQALAPRRLVNENHNVSEYLFDGLAEVIISTCYGEEAGVPVGNTPLADYSLLPTPTIDALLADPAAYLQGASQYWLYQLDAWQSQPHLPVYTVELFRRTFVRPASGDRPDDIGIRLRYFDGQLRDLASVNLVSGRPPYRMGGELRTGWHSSAITDPARAEAAQWVVSDQLRYDKQGNPIVKYQPYFANQPLYQPQPDAACWTMHYDALDRLVQGQTPDGFLTATEYQPWLTRYWDQDDTVLQSPYYRTHINNPDLPASERAALEMAAGFADTPLTVELDGFSRRMQDENILKQGGKADVLLRNYHWYDVADRLTALVDPRFYNAQNPDQPHFYNFFVQYDMQDRPSWQKGADAGNQPLRGPTDGIPWLRLFDATGGLIDEWDRRGVHHHTEFNSLGQPISLQWLGAGLDCLAVRYSYGSDAAYNTVNRLILQQDQAGEERTTLYSLLGDPVSQSRQFVEAWQGLTDWRLAPVLQTTLWRWENRRNARGEPIGYLAPNGSATQIAHSLNGWPRQLALALAGQTGSTTLATIDSFTAQGTGKSLILANGARIDHEYDDKILRLRRIRIQTGSKLLQDIAYTYDPVGNVTNLANHTPPLGSPILPIVNYQSGYDSIYQLTSATGLRTNEQTQLVYYQRAYQYDRSGNLTQVSDDAGPAWSSQFRIAASANHAICEATLSDPDQYYDADGSLTELPDLTRLATDPAGCLQSATAPDGAATWAQYADNRSRLRKVFVPSGGVPQQSYYLQPFIAEGDLAAAASLTLYLGGSLLGSADFAAGSHGAAASVQYQTGDRLNSVVLRLDQQGDVIDRQEYYPYGATAFNLQQGAQSPAERRRYQYTGQEKDPSTGLYSFPERYFSPALSRWISPDPAGTVDGSNLFAYARNNPLTYNDPTGECGQPPQKKPAPLKTFKESLNSIGLGSTYGNAIGDMFSGALRLHHTPTELLTHNAALKAAVTIKLANITGLSAIYGGATGVIYHSLNIKKYGFNVYDATSITAYGLFAYEGFSVIKALTIKSQHDFHAAHLKIGRIGMYVDLMKLPYYVKNGDVDKVVLYAGLANANWRSSVTTRQARNAYSRLGSLLVSPYNLVATARDTPVITKQAIQRAALRVALVQPWQVLLGTLAIYPVLSQLKKKTDEH